MNVKQVAIKLISQVDKGAYSNIALNESFKTLNINLKEKAFLTEIFYGVIRNKKFLDYIIEKNTKEIKKEWIRNLLRISIYQITFMDSDNKGIVWEGTELAKKKYGVAISKFINGTLRNYLRNKGLELKKLYDEKGSEAKQYYHYFSGFNNAIPSIVKTLNGKTLTKANLAAIKPASQEDSRNLQILNSLVQDAGNVGKTPKEVEELLRKEIEGALKHYGSQATKHYNLDFDPRAEIVGDNYDNYNEKHYGNNHYEGPDASHGTHVSGIIAGLPHGNEAQYGVAHKVAKIMTVRAVPDGDERDKDVANAIRYAVDNGAKILNMSFGKAVSPGKKHVWEAMKYAEKKGVLLVKAAGNENQNIGENEYFPTNFMKQSDEKPFVSNMIVVGASTNNSQNLRARFSNYNGKMVDVFAPGQEIYSTVPDAKYEYLQGTSMASPVVAGAAAVLWAYMPSLTPQQIKEALVKTVNKSTVNANVDSSANFDQISVAGGVIDLYKAAQYAYDNFYNKKGVKANRKAAKSK